MSKLQDRFPGYDVMAKRDTPSFNDVTRTVLNQRLSLSDDDPNFLTVIEFSTLKAIADRIVPQTAKRNPIPVAALIDRRLEKDKGDGYRKYSMPQQREAWCIGLAALNTEAQQAYELSFRDLGESTQDLLLRKMKDGELISNAWKPMTAKQFFKERLLHDIVLAYYSHPHSWNEMGFGGPASPRGYVRLDINTRDPWEAAEAKSNNDGTALKENLRVNR